MLPTDTPPTAAFEAELHAEGFVEIQTRDIAGGTHNAVHAHPFEVKAMMLAGELQLGCGGETTTYRAGDVFTMAAGREHVEQFGAGTARYVVGRRYPAQHPA